MGYLLNLAYLSVLALTLPFWVYKAVTTGKYRQGLWRKLRGCAPAVDPNRPVVWFHAVSVGEVLLLRPLLERLALHRPDLQCVLSTTTNTGYDLALKTFPRIPLFYFPLDFTWAVNRVLRDLKPELLVLAELELWPNLLMSAKRRGVPVAVVNCRLSERSFRGYSRIRSLLRPALDAVAWWGVQTDAYAQRVCQLLGSGVKVQVTGSMKYDGVCTDRGNPRTMQLARLLGVDLSGDSNSALWVAGSTVWPEEQLVLDAYLKLREQHSDLRLVIVPRHQERFEAVAEYLTGRGVDFRRRSRLQASEHWSILLFDTIGELAPLWGTSDFGYVGGSMNCGRGGQSMIEPAGFGVPVCFGPDTRNFRHTVENLLADDAAVEVRNGAELVATLSNWLANRADAQAMGDRAQQFILSQQGAVAATYTGVVKLLPPLPAAAKSA